MAKVKEKTKKKLTRGKKILLCLLGIVLVVVGIIVARWLIKYQLYTGYKEDITTYTYEKGGTFTPIEESSADVKDEGYVLAAENDILKLYVNPENGYVAIYDRRNGEITYSNPSDADLDEVATPINISYMKSQIIVSYYDSNRRTGTMNSFDDCVSYGQLTLQSLEDGVRLIYTLGELESDTGIVPAYISEETLEWVCANCSNGEFVKAKYETDSSLKKGYLKLKDTVVKNGTSQLEGYFAEAGFTQADYLTELENSGVDDALPMTFVVPLEYRLVEDAVEASIPMSGVAESGGGYLYEIQMNRYLGCAGADEEGYMLVPDGSGALINFNNGKYNVATYSEFIYGEDPLAEEYTVVENTEDAKMALFGIFREDSAIFATIESGSSLASVNAAVSGKVTMKNCVYASFTLRGDDKLAMFGSTGNEADLPIVENTFYDADLTVRYTMLVDEDASYAGAANYYRNRLIGEGVLTASTDSTSASASDIKFYYDILGATTITKYFLGTQYDGTYAMTTFDEAAAISEDLADLGITNQVMNFQGWMNGGYSHNVTSSVKLVHSLGSKKDLEALSDTLSEIGGTFYADVAFQKVTTISKHYEENNETSRYYGSGYICELGLVNPTTFRQTSGLGYDENRYYLLSPKFLSRYVDSFAEKTENYDISGISLRDLGNELHSDKRRTNVINREQALDIVEASLQTLEDTGKSLLVNDGNDYSWAYASDLINVPLSANEYFIIDEEIPFYEMIVHGCIDYSGTLINLNDSMDDDELVLNLIENGASPHFVFTENSSSEIKNTGLNRYYATTYDNWSEYAADIYGRVNEALQYVKDAYMVDYEIVSDSVRAVTYSNGVCIYLNYTGSDTTVDGVKVPARSYALGGI